MTSKLTGRIEKMERRTAPDDLERWQNTPVEMRPDWVLTSQILDRLVTPEQADRLDRDEKFETLIEALVVSLREDAGIGCGHRDEHGKSPASLRSNDEGTEEWRTRRDLLIDYAERLLLQPLTDDQPAQIIQEERAAKAANYGHDETSIPS